MSTFRIINAVGKRISTAVITKNAQFLQVFPEKKYFGGKEDWLSAYPRDIVLKETPKVVSITVKKPNKTKTDRLKREMTEFIDRDFLSLVSRVTFVSHDTVKITTKDNDKFQIHRSLDFFKAPTIYKNGGCIEICNDQYSPALTSSKWFLMVAFVTH